MSKKTYTKLSETTLVPKGLSRKMKASLIVLILMASLVGGFVGYTIANPSAQSMYAEEGIYPGAPSYTVWREGSTYYAKDAYGTMLSGYDVGSSNASQIINNALLGGTGIVFLLDAIYSLDSSVLLSDGDILQGESRKSTILQWAGSLEENAVVRDKSDFDGDLDYYEEDVVIKDLTVDCNLLKAQGIALRYVKRAIVSNVLAKNYKTVDDWGIGIALVDSEDSIIENCVLLNGQGTFIEGARITGTLGCRNTVRDSVFNGIDGRGLTVDTEQEDSLVCNNKFFDLASDGVHVIGTPSPRYTRGIIITQNHFISCGRAINVDASTQNMADIEVQNNVITGTHVDYAIFIRNVYRAVVSDNIINVTESHAIYISSVLYEATITGNHIYEAGGIGIYYLGQGYDVKICLNTILRSYATGIEIANTGTLNNITVSENTAKDNSLQGVGVAAGIKLGDVKGAVIIGNHAYDSRATKMQKYGIWTVGTSDYNVIMANICRTNENGSSDIVYAGSNNLVVYNIGRYTPQGNP